MDIRGAVDAAVPTNIIAAKAAEVRANLVNWQSYLQWVRTHTSYTLLFCIYCCMSLVCLLSSWNSSRPFYSALLSSAQVPQLWLTVLSDDSFFCTINAPPNTVCVCVGFLRRARGMLRLVDLIVGAALEIRIFCQRKRSPFNSKVNALGTL